MSRWVKSTLGPEVPLHLTRFHPDCPLETPAHALLDAEAMPQSRSRGSATSATSPAAAERTPAVRSARRR